MPRLVTIGRGSLWVMRAVVPDSWMPLRCMTSVIGARCRLAPIKPFNAWPEIQPASPQWQMTKASGPWAARNPSDQPALTGTVTPRRPEPIGVPPGTHDT